jgi:hypothetical protein
VVQAIVHKGDDRWIDPGEFNLSSQRMLPYPATSRGLGCAAIPGRVKRGSMPIQYAEGGGQQTSIACAESVCPAARILDRARDFTNL